MVAEGHEFEPATMNWESEIGIGKINNRSNAELDPAQLKQKFQTSIIIKLVVCVL